MGPPVHWWTHLKVESPAHQPPPEGVPGERGVHIVPEVANSGRPGSRGGPSTSSPELQGLHHATAPSENSQSLGTLPRREARSRSLVLRVSALEVDARPSTWSPKVGEGIRVAPGDALPHGFEVHQEATGRGSTASIPDNARAAPPEEQCSLQTGLEVPAANRPRSGAQGLVPYQLLWCVWGLL